MFYEYRFGISLKQHLHFWYLFNHGKAIQNKDYSSRD